MTFRFLLLGLFLAPVVRAQEIHLAQPYYITPRTGSQHVDVRTDWQLGYRDSTIQVVTELTSVTTWINVAEPTTVQMALAKAGCPTPTVTSTRKNTPGWIKRCGTTARTCR